jgi:uncharacterized membrane protein
MISALSGIAFIVFASVWAARDARAKGLPVAPYIGSCVLVVAVCIGMVIGGISLSDLTGDETTSTLILVASMIATLAASIWLTVFLFKRLQRKASSDASKP